MSEGRTLPTERTHTSQNFPFPREGQTVHETPPTLIWIPDEKCKKYTVTVWDGGGRVAFCATTEDCFAYDRRRWESGSYTWDVVGDDGSARGVQSFTVAEDAVFFDRPTADEVLRGIPPKRPRHLFTAADISEIVKNRAAAIASLRKTAALAYENGLAPAPIIQHGVGFAGYREYFGRYRDYCDRDLVCLSLLYSLTGDMTAAEAAKARLMHIASLGTEGAMALNGKYGDEVGLSGARCLPAVFDMLYPILDREERARVAETVASYGEQCYARLRASDYKTNPASSHVGRLPAYLGEAAIALFGEGVRPEATLTEWLSFALDVYEGPFPHYGTPDGAWAEGPFYSTSYTRWYLPFFSAVERFSGKSLLSRPFYMNFTDFLLHFCHPDYEIHPFGDGYWCRPEDEEWPGFFAQNPFRVYADRFGGKTSRALAERLSSVDYYRLHLLDLFLPECGAEPSQRAEHIGSHLFEDGGLVALHTAMGEPDDVCLLSRASAFPVGSHRHADQGSFALFKDGVAIVSPSGYYGRGFGTRHHVEWTRSTRAHNLPLIDGRGQAQGLTATGRITHFDKEKNTATLELADAYSDPRIISYKRTLSVDAGGASITDVIEATEPITLDCNLHFLSPISLCGDALTLERGGVRMTLTREGEGLSEYRITDEFAVDLNEGVPSEVAVEMPKQYHAAFEVSPSRTHTLRMRFELCKI